MKAPTCGNKKMKPLLIMQTGDAPPQVRARHGNFAAMFLRGADYRGLETAVVHVAAGEKLKPPSAYAGVLITGSEAMVTDGEPWSLAAGQWLVQAAGIAGYKILGVCYGHQLLAQSLGGEVDYHPQGAEIGNHNIRLREGAGRHSFLSGLPANFRANLFHRQSVLKAPPQAVCLASSRHDPHQILAYGPDIMGVQFHPEFDDAITSTYIEFFARPQAPDREFKSADACWAVRLLQNFIASLRP
jgi:GMP synthase (glutamine-hydrolysing)